MEENKETRKDIHNLSHKDSIDKYQEENAVGKELSASGYVAWQPKPGNFEEQIYSEDAELQTYPLDWLRQGRRNEKAKMQAENLVKAMESVAEVHADWTAESLSKDMELVPGGSNNNKEEKLSKDTKSMKNFPDLNQKQSTNAASYTQIEDPADRMEESPRKNLRWEPENLDNRKEKLISEDVNEQSHDEKNERAPIESLAVLSVVLDKNNEPDTCEDSESEEEVNGVCPSPPHLEKNANETVETPIIDYGLVETAVTEAVATAHTVIDATGGVQVNGETNVNNDVKNVCLSSQRNARNDDIVGMQYDCNDKEEVMKSKLDEYKVTGPNSSIEETTNEEIKRDINITAGVGNKSLNSFHFDPHDEGNESGAEEEQTAFMEELETFFKVRSMEFKPPKFYGEGLNLLKLWRAVTRLGGYEQVTSCKLWRQVGESFKPPKTCTTVSWTFRCFYEKALLDYEKHKTHGDELPLPDTSLQQPGGGENQSVHSHASGSGRTRRDAAARAMQGWHSQRLLGNGEVGDPIIKDKHSSPPLMKREKQFKSVGLLKRKRPASVENAVKLARVKPKKPQLDTVIVDVGSPADWVKINVRKTKDCFEVYALVPGLLREEVRVQSDPAGRLVISGEPEHVDNPWGVTPFKKVVSLPSRIDPHQTSAVVTLHGQLFVRVPFEQSDL